MKKMNFYFNPTKVGLLCLTILSLFAARVSAQCPPLNFSYPASCPATVSPTTATGNSSVVLERFANGTGSEFITTADIGKVLRYQNIATGCWNTLTVEDKSGPVVTPPVDAIIQCSDPNANLVLPVGTPPAGYIGQFTSQGATIGYPTITDCGGVLEFSYTDIVLNPGCGGVKTVQRLWKAKDIYGNVGTAAQAQTIYVVRPAVTNQAEAEALLSADYKGTVNVTCTAALPAALATTPVSVGCGITVSFLNDTRVNLCGNTYKVLRTYQITDACGAGGMAMYTVTQTINVKDVTTPKLTVSGTSYPTVKNVPFTICGADALGRKVNAAAVSVEAGNVAGALSATTPQTSLGAIAITAWGDATMCGAGRFTLNVGSTDNCANGTITTNDSRFAVVNGEIRGTVMANTNFNIIATDACGNTSTVAVTVLVEDNISPTAICDGVTATLNNYKQAVIDGRSFNNASSDNCGIVRILVAKAVGTDVPTAWCNTVTYECADLAVTGLKVWVRYIDAADNFTDCCVPVTIVDKATVTCLPGTTVDRECTSTDLNNLDGLFGAPSYFYDGCSTPVITFTTDNSGISCGVGTIVRTWKFTISNSATSTQSVTCTKGINVVARRGFRVRALADTETTCIGAYDLQADKAQVVRNLQLLYAAPAASSTITIADPSTPGGVRSTLSLISSTSAAPGTTAAYTRFNYAAGGHSQNYSGPRGINTWDPITTIAAIDGASPQQRINATAGMITGTPTCASPVVEAADWFYSNSEYCKVYVQVFTIKDACDFSADNSTTTFGVPISNSGTFTFPTTGLSDTLYTPSLPQDGLFQSAVVNGKHIIRFTRLVKVLDKTAPTSTAPADIAICDGTAADTDSDNCEFGFSRTIAGTDNCGTTASGSSLVYTWSIVNTATNATVVSGTGSTVSRNNLAFGTYKVTYRVADLCGNISNEYTFNVSGADCKAPQILVHDKIVALAGQTGNRATGMAQLLYIDIRNNIFDNCAGDLTNSNKIVMELVLAGEAASPLTPRSTEPNTSIMLSCANLPEAKVRVWAVDGSGNWNFATSTITVQDNDGICSARPVIAGTIGTEAGAPVKDVVVSANANGIVAASASSVAAGTYQVTGLTAGTNYQVRAAKTMDNDKKNGVTTLDIALISKHLLAETELNSAYKIIAADVDKNGEVDATDMLHIRRFILSVTSNLPAGSAWRFVDKSYAFRNAANPLGEDFPEVVSLANVPVGTNAANFTAVKLGDVNNSFDATTVRGSRVLALSTEDMNVVAGNEYTVAIAAENMNAAAFQGTFSFDGAKVKAVKAGTLNNVSDNNFNMTANAVATSWNGKSEASATVANITFVATKSGKLSEMLTVNSALTMAEGYDAVGNAMNVTLKFSNGKVAGGEFALYQNTPNPVATSTKIGFNLPKDGQAKLTIYTAEGKVLSVTNNNYKAGYNEVTVNKSDLNASGMLYYRLDTQDNSSTRKMIVIE
jgi:hypothetical protein